MLLLPKIPDRCPRFTPFVECGRPITRVLCEKWWPVPQVAPFYGANLGIPDLKVPVGEANPHVVHDAVGETVSNCDT